MRALTSKELFKDRLTDEEAKEALKRLWDYSCRSAPDTLLIEGIGPLLQQIEDKKIKMALWTGRDSLSAQRILKHHGIEIFFTAMAKQNPT